ncbi:MAG: O-succinylhomoserine sulfhydrylase [Hyphomicrobiales bacterium]|nr:MAG: O-succinylhomoserine sulfhydrylase [Hyphomicrobiales bacterium]
MTNEWKPDTALVHGGTARTPHGETSEALYLNSGFTYPSAEAAEARFAADDPGFVYSRFANPTVRMFEERMIALDGAGDARATGTGMAAVHGALMSRLSVGDHVVAARALFGSSLYILNKLLPRFGVRVTLVDGSDLDAWRRAAKGGADVFFLESPTNPTMEVVDIAAVADIAHRAGAVLVVDNVFATPLKQRPFELGADVVLYSATKHIDGQGRCLGGIILGDKKYVSGPLHDYLKHTGPSLSPFNAWVLLKGLETLSLRVERHQANAAAIAAALHGKAGVKRVLYPGHDSHPQYDIASKQMSGGGPMLAVEMAGGKPAAFAFCDALKLMLISNNLGDAKTLICHPATTTHKSLTDEQRAELGISGGLLRISAGLEDGADLVADVQGALAALPS